MVQHPNLPQGFSNTFDARFWAKIVKNGKRTKYDSKIGRCWDWIGAKSPLGQPKIGIGGRRGKIIIGSRASWLINRGPIEHGKDVLHKCDNPSCCNPDHLFIGTHTDNMRDMIVKGRARHPFGEDHCKAKLTWKKVHIIRKIWKSVRPRQQSLADKFGVSKGTIGAIVVNRTWINPAPNR